MGKGGKEKGADVSTYTIHLPQVPHALEPTVADMVRGVERGLAGIVQHFTATTSILKDQMFSLQGERDQMAVALKQAQREAELAKAQLLQAQMQAQDPRIVAGLRSAAAEREWVAAAERERVAATAAAAALESRGLGAAGRRNPPVAQPRRFTPLDIEISHTGPVHSVLFHKDQDQLLLGSASWSGDTALYSMTNHSMKYTLKHPEPSERVGMYCVGFSKQSDKPILGTACADNAVYLYNFRSGACLGALAGQYGRDSGHDNEVNCIDFHANQNVLCSAGDDCKVLIWDFGEQTILRSLDKFPKAAYSCRFLEKHGEYFVATTCFDHKTRIIDMRDKSVVAQLEGHQDEVVGIDLNDRCVATSADDGKVIMWDPRTWRPVSIYQYIQEGAPKEVKRIAFSPDGKLLAVGTASNTILVLDANDLQSGPIDTLHGHDNTVFDVAWSADDRSGKTWLASAGHDHKSKLWEYNANIRG